MFKMKLHWVRVIVFSACFGFPYIMSRIDAVAGSSCIPSEILKDDKFSYDNSMAKWLSYIDLNTKNEMIDQSKGRQFKYGSTTLTANDAKSAASYFSTETRYNLTERQQTSVLYTYLSDNRLQAYMNCLKFSQSNIFIEFPAGSESESIFQAVIG